MENINSHTEIQQEESLKFKEWFKTKLEIGPMIHEPINKMGQNRMNHSVVINVCDFSNFDYAKQFDLSQYYWFPINETQKEIGLNSIYAALWTLMQAHKNNMSVYLHCFSGRNRSKMVGAMFYWMITGEDLDAPTYGARNRHDKSDTSATQYKNRFVYNCEIGVIPPEEDVKKWLLYLKEVFNNGYVPKNIGIMDYSRIHFFPNWIPRKKYKFFNVIPVEERLPTETAGYTVEIEVKGDGSKSWYTKYVYFSLSSGWEHLSISSVSGISTITHWYEEVE